MHHQKDVRLADRTTLGLGGVASRLVTVEDESELRGLARETRASGQRLFVLGGGSNLVVGDGGTDRPLVSIGMTDLELRREGEKVRMTVSAGLLFDSLVARSVDERLAGLECLSGIPGQVGATPIQNVGAYGQEVADTLSSVRVYDQETDTFLDVPARECDFAYRHSRFRGDPRFIVTRVEFLLESSPFAKPIRYAELAKALDVPIGGTRSLDEMRSMVLSLRRGKGMVLDASDPESRSAGSFFTNPIVSTDLADQVDRAAGRPAPRFPAPGGAVKLAAAWLVEAAGFAKGFAVNDGASISKKHALALVNRGGSAADLLELARAVQRGVESRFGVRLEPEPIFLGCRL